MEEKYVSGRCEKANKNNSNKFCLLKDSFCFGNHGELSVLLRNVKFYFDIKPISSGVADAILQVILCNVKHLIVLCNLNNKTPNGSILIGYEKNNWQHYKTVKAPTKFKQLYLEVALSEYLLIENYKMLIDDAENSKSGCLEKLIAENKECLIYLRKQIDNSAMKIF